MNKEKTKIVGYRVKKIHVKSLNEHVRKFLLSKNYKLYAKRKNNKAQTKKAISKEDGKTGEKSYAIKGTVERVKQPNS